MASDVSQRAREAAWQMICRRLGRNPATSEEDETCSLRAAWKAMIAFSAQQEAEIRAETTLPPILIDPTGKGYPTDERPMTVAEFEAVIRADATAVERERCATQPRKGFPILGGQGAKVDFQLVADHGKQAQANHYQTVERLAERGGLSWCELHAVLSNRKWQKMDENDAIVECRAIEARYLAAIRKGATT